MTRGSRKYIQQFNVDDDILVMCSKLKNKQALRIEASRKT